MALAEEQERNRSQQHRTRPDAKCQGLFELVYGFGRSEPEYLSGFELGNNKVVVAIEPFRHFHCGDFI